jgi:hypothetical protein
MSRPEEFPMLRVPFPKHGEGAKDGEEEAPSPSLERGLGVRIPAPTVSDYCEFHKPTRPDARAISTERTNEWLLMIL